MIDPVLIMVAPNGARRTKADHPALPMTPDELGETARACRDAGAGAIHLHVRGDDGGHVLDVERYRAASEAVCRDAGPDFAIQVTTEAVGRYRPAEQMAAMRALQPDVFSVAVRELFPEGDRHTEEDAAAFLTWCHEAGIGVQYILYSDIDLERFLAHVHRGAIPGNRWSVLFVLGRYSANMTSDPNDLIPFLNVLNQASERDRVTWMVCAFGGAEATVVSAALSLGGHARVGFENNLWLPSGEVAPDNAALVGLAAKSREILGYPAAVGTDALRILGKP